MDDRSGGDPFGNCSKLARFFYDPFPPLLQCLGRIWEEYQAGNAIAALKAKLAISASVKRDGEWITAVARTLVPGDVIRLHLGDIIPADTRLLAGDPNRSGPVGAHRRVLAC